ncbi:MAG: NADH-quinone oxidoreductase subunit M [Chloroflexi bacterium]|nr:NADH-quinone oxidoreductase subunit M [Chloroflexota bacterium]
MFPLLSAIIFLPVLGAVLIALTPRARVTLIRALAFVFSGAALALALALFAGFSRNVATPQYVERAAWIPQLGISYFLGVDGLSLPFIVLTAMLTFLAVIASWHIELRPKEYFALMLVLETGVLGVFSSLDFLLFFLFWEVELIPMYLLIGTWGGPRREYAAIKFVIYTLAGSALMLVGILTLYFFGSAHTFDMLALRQQGIDPVVATFAFFLVFFGFAVKLPSFPFHTWLPDAHVEAPTAVSVLLAGVLLKMGGYGMLRVNVGMMPDVLAANAPFIGALAVVSILYGAAVSTVQHDLKSLVAYSSVSHMGYVLLGIAALTPGSLGGAAVQMFTHGLITGLLFLLVGVVYERTHTRIIASMGGLAPRMPLIATIFVIAGLASLGLPATAGFIGEFAVFVGAYPSLPWLTIVAIFGVVATAGYILWMLQRVFFGPPNPRWAALTDANRWFEVAPLVTLAALVLVVGIVPSLLTDIIQASVPGLASSPLLTAAR